MAARDRGGLELVHANVCPVQQAMVAAGGAPGMWIRCTPEGPDGDVRAVTFLPDAGAPPPLRCLAYDIETCWAEGKLQPGSFPQVYDPAGRIIQVGLSCLDGSTPAEPDHVLCLGCTETATTRVTCVEDEAALLEAFGAEVRRLDPDCVCGYNIHGFDVDWLCGRAEYIDIFRRLPDAATAVTVWRWAVDFMRAYPAKAPREEISAWLRTHRTMAPPEVEWNTRRSTAPDATAQRLAAYRTPEAVREAWAYFHRQRSPAGFWRCGRRAHVPGHMEISTSKTGADARRFDMEGRLTVDLFQYVKENYNGKFKSFTLKNVATYLTHDPKIDLSYADMMAHYCSGDAARRGVVADYCARDCVIPARLCDKLASSSTS